MLMSLLIKGKRGGEEPRAHNGELVSTCNAIRCSQEVKGTENSRKLNIRCTKYCGKVSAELMNEPVFRYSPPPPQNDRPCQPVPGTPIIIIGTH